MNISIYLAGKIPNSVPGIWRTRNRNFRFDLSKAPLLRTKVFRLDETRHLCLLNIHHIITDGWSAMLMLDEVSQLYRAGGSLSDKPQWQFRDFSVWHDEYLNGEDGNRDLEFWRKILVSPRSAACTAGTYG